MAQAYLNQRLSTMDACFLYLEKKEAPLHIGGIHVFEGDIPFETFVEMLEARLPFLPRYCQKVVPAPFNLCHPTWEFDPAFDIRNHIFRLKIQAPGTLDQLRELAQELLNGMLDRNKPLWEMYIVNGLAGGKSALISKVHHAMADGISAVDLMKLIFDISPEPAPLPEGALAFQATPYRNEEPACLLEALLHSLQEIMESWTEFHTRLLDVAGTWNEEASLSLSGAEDIVLPALTTPVSPLPFNRQNTGKQKLAWAEYSFSALRAIRSNLGGTVNDIVLTVLSGAVAYYVELHGEETAGRMLRIMLPVSMRREEQHGALGNLVSFLPVEVPLYIRDPLERYAFLTKRTGLLKSSRVAEKVNLFITLLGAVPAPVQALAGTLANTTVPAFNIVCTNVPGPQTPLYLLGKRMTASYPYVPVALAVGVSCGIISYDQRLFFGVTAEATGMPDSEKFKEFLDLSFAQLRDAAGVSEIRPIKKELKKERPWSRTFPGKPKERSFLK